MSFKKFVIKEFYNTFSMIDLSSKDEKRQTHDNIDQEESEDTPLEKSCEELLKIDKNGDELSDEDKTRLNVCKLRSYMQYVTAAN